jgi:hypothetical protein
MKQANINDSSALDNNYVFVLSGEAKDADRLYISK